MAISIGQAADAKGKSPPVFPPHARQHGKSLAEWQARDWQIYLGYPYDAEACSLGPFGRFGEARDLIHLNVSGGTPVEFTCTIPSGVSLLLPVLTGWYACPVDCGPGKVAPNGTEEELAAAINELIDTTSYLEVEIDGRSIPNLFDYRTTSPAFYGEAVPGNGLDPFYLGPYGPAVAAGYFVMVPPLSVGAHTIRILAVLGSDPPVAVFETVHNLTVAPGPVQR